MSHARLALLLALALGFAPASTARAQTLAGTINAGVIAADFDVGTNVGAGGWTDVWAAFDWFRIGGFAGALTIPSSLDARDRFATPVGLSMAAVFASLGDYDLVLRVRGGMWAGSTQQVKLTAGGFLGGGLFADIHLGGGANFGLGVEVWSFLGAGQDVAIVPTLSLTWGPAPPAQPSPSPSSPDYGSTAIPP